MDKTNRDKVYTVVEVWRGMVSKVHAFRNRDDAEACYTKLAAAENFLENDVELVEVTVH